MDPARPAFSPRSRLKVNLMRKFLTTIVFATLAAVSANAAASVSIGIQIGQYPTLQRIPGYPVYYAPGLRANYFFYDGLYWVYFDGNWYASPWYDGPWDFVGIDSVPLYVLRVPVRYYGYPPVMFSRWVVDAPPRWDSVWGPNWAHRHRNWEHWNRAHVPPPAPLPRYQERFTRDNYPNDVQRRQLVQQHYGYAPRDAQVRQRWEARPGPVHQSQPQMARQPEIRTDNPRPFEHNEPNAGRHAPPREAQVSRPERPPVAVHGRPEEHEIAHGERPEHGGRPDRPDRPDRPERPNKPDKEDGHEPGKRH
jgi:hypothetical protein